MARRRRSVLARPTRVALVVVLVVANLTGAAVVLVLAGWVLPTGAVADPGGARLANVALLAAYLVVAVPAGMVVGGRRFLEPRGGDADARGRRERRLVMYGPLRLVLVQAVLWLVAVVLFAVLNLRFSPRLAMVVGETVLLAGITTSAMTYLLAERILRRTAARVLQRGSARRRRGLPGVVVRSFVFWALGTAVPVVGLLLAAASALVFNDVPAEQLAVVLLALGATALVVGLASNIGAARAVADPVNGVRQAMDEVARGDLNVRVPVYDGTELGRLQAGFNTMIAGLRERERLQDLFGRQVGRDVATAALAAHEVRLGGEVRQVAVLFVDLVGSTALAARCPPEEVVALLNRFFGVVVDVVEQHGGWINKFEGDAALAVFGAPAPHAGPAGGALAAGRALAPRLAAELTEVDVGVGVSAGDAVAGNVGDVRRYEYTVIGDPVNEAARLSECAKQMAGRVCASGRAVELAGPDEAERWEIGESRLLRGRAEPTPIAVPVVARPAPA